MSDPKFVLFQKRSRNQRFHGQRKGAVLPLFVMLLPVILILCGFAINMAYMQLTRTEMKVATDVASHAGGRAMSEAQREILTNTSDFNRRSQIVAKTYEAIETASKWNRVGGKELNVRLDDQDVHFGYSTRQGQGMYEFNRVPVDQIKAGIHRASSVGVIGQVNIPLVFQTMNISNFDTNRRSIATQVDRDIALVIDTSGSMLFYKDIDEINDTIRDLYNDVVRKRRLVTSSNGQFQYYEYYNERRIDYDDAIAALGWYQTNGRWQNSELARDFSEDVITEVFELWTRSNDQEHKDIHEYMFDWEQYENGLFQKMTKSPRHSRWSFLAQGVEAFLDVLGGAPDGSSLGTDQKELISLVTFATGAQVDVALTDDDIRNGGVAYYQNIRNTINDLVPIGSTAIGQGLQKGLPPIVDPDWAQNNNVSGAAARPFAEKTIVVMTDGENNQTPEPEDAVNGIVVDNAVTIHTVTFSSGANQAAMRKVADAGGGVAYHTDEGEELISIFEEIANNLPTILTE